MSDLVNKNDVIKNAKDFTFTFAEERRRYMDFLEYCLDNTPPVEAVPVVHGEWLKTNAEHQWRCNKCDIIHFIAQYPHGQANFCPNCGANMRKKVE